MKKVLIVGDIYLETQFFVKEIPSPKQFSFAKDTLTITGSKTVNAARVFAKLGDESHFYGKVGDDKISNLIRLGLKNYQINSDHIVSVAGKKSGIINVITNESGESSITLFSGANQSFSEEDIEELSDIILNFDFLYTATYLKPKLLYKLVLLSWQKGVPLFLDFPNQHETIDLEKINKVDYVMPNRQEAELILKRKIKSTEDAYDAIKELRQKLKKNILITLDQAGCLYLAEGSNKPKYFNVDTIKQTDATGAGDIFRAVFSSAISNGANAEEAIARAQKISRASVKIKGVNETINKLRF